MAGDAEGPSRPPAGGQARGKCHSVLKMASQWPPSRYGRFLLKLMGRAWLSLFLDRRRLDLCEHCCGTSDSPATAVPACIGFSAE